MEAWGYAAGRGSVHRILRILTVVTLCRVSLAWGPPDATAVVGQAADRGERVWEEALRLDRDLASRSLFEYAFLLLETGRHPERLERLLDLAQRMQDRDRDSQGFGNFRWKWADGTVLDANAVEFCMQHASLIQIRHRDRLAAPVANGFDGLLDHAVQACLRHHVPSSYTNIALMNAANLVLLGEARRHAAALAEGRARLDAFCVYTALHGIHEYGSPTYYGVDLDDLLLLHRFTRSDEIRAQVEALLGLFWRDLAANWFAPGERLGGVHSRDYDYLRGLGGLDGHLAAAGWLAPERPAGGLPVAAALTEWRPPQALRAANLEQHPRWVVQAWGSGVADTRCHWVTPDVTLSTAGAAYGGSMDLPLTVDFAQPRESVRAYVIADCRRDPYGRKRIPAGGGHEKALHANPFWAATQDRGEALGLVLYRPQDLRDEPPTVESHLVFPADADEVFAGPRSLTLEARTGVVALPPDGVLAVRRGKGAFAVRVPWSRTLDGEAAPLALVFDGTRVGACRLTVVHHALLGGGPGPQPSGAAFWVRVAEGLDSTAFHVWAAAFAAMAPGTALDEPDRLRLEVPGTGSPLALEVASPWQVCGERRPEYGRPVLSVNGDDSPSRALQSLAAVRRQAESLARAVAVAVGEAGTATWEAESGSVAPMLQIAASDAVFGGQYVWAPGTPGARGGGDGVLTCKVVVRQAGTYCLWGRVLAPTPEDDSFFVRVYREAGEICPKRAWHTGVHTEWEWVPVILEGFPGTPATGFALPAGDVRIEISVREDGIGLDQLFLSSDASKTP